MRPQPFHRHFLSHWPAYLLLLCLGAVAGLTLFRLTVPPDDAPRLLLIRGDAPPPEMDYDAEIDYAGKDAPPDLHQMYVLATGSGGYDAFCAPVALLDELYAEGLIQPLSLPDDRLGGQPGQSPSLTDEQLGGQPGQPPFLPGERPDGQPGQSPSLSNEQPDGQPNQSPSLTSKQPDGQLNQSPSLTEALTAADGTPVALPLDNAYALCLAHHADADALLRLWPGK